MKKITLSVALASIVMASCQKQETDIAVSKNDSFKASVEAFVPATKTSMTPERAVVWSQDDRIAIFQGSSLADEYVVTDAGIGKSNATFTKVTTSGEDYNAGTEFPCNVALYPYAEGLTITGPSSEDESTAYAIEGVVLPAEQTYAEGSFANGAFLMAAVTDGLSDNNLKFKNVLGALKLQLKGTHTVKSIKVAGKNNEVLSGAAAVSADTNPLIPTITMTATDEASKSVILNCGDGVQLSESTATDFIISLPPTVFEAGFTVTVTCADDVEEVIETDKENEVQRSKLLVMPEVSLGGESSDDTYVDYVDEYGVNHGPGIEIGGVVWAPVNCGYKAATATEKGYPYGKLYQWGRKYGQGYDENDESVPTLLEGNVSLEVGQSEDNKNVFFFCSDSSDSDLDWLSPRDGTLWNSGTEESPIKNTANDPCPIGWRVPTFNELNDLRSVSSNQSSIDAEGRNGYIFSASVANSDAVAELFLPAAGRRHGNGGRTDGREQIGFYWFSTPNSFSYGTININYANYLSFGCSTADSFSQGLNTGSTGRFQAHSVRCVQE